MEVDVLLRSVVAGKDPVLPAVVLLSLIPSSGVKMMFLRSDDPVIFASFLRENVGIVLLLLL